MHTGDPQIEIYIDPPEPATCGPRSPTLIGETLRGSPPAAGAPQLELTGFPTIITGRLSVDHSRLVYHRPS